MAQLFHDGCWCIKILFVIAFFIGSMWIPNTFFKGYLEFSRVISAIFLIYQALLMLQVAYKTNDRLVSNYQRDTTNCSKYILAIVAAAFFAIVIASIVTQYQTFKCGNLITLMTITLVAVVLMHGLILLRPRKDASILTSSIASVYILYLQWTALSSESN